ncbi:MAG: SDR family oxidoreductase [Cloacibacillus sp.]
MDNTNQRPFILITGASSGVGRATAVALSDAYNLILHGRNMEKLEKTKSLCSNTATIFLWPCDFGVIEMVENSLVVLLTHLKIKISGLVYSAGMVEMLPLRALSLDKLRDTFNTNFLSAAIISKVLVQKKMNGTELKNIVFISSNISDRGGKAFSVYAASKGALDSFMRCLAVELAPRVRVNSLLPGGMRTEMTEDICKDTALMERMEATYPLGMGKPENIAAAVKFLLSDDGSWITGQTITIDGGRTINITG